MGLMGKQTGNICVNHTDCDCKRCLVGCRCTVSCLEELSLVAKQLLCEALIGLDEPALVDVLRRLWQSQTDASLKGPHTFTLRVHLEDTQEAVFFYA